MPSHRRRSSVHRMLENDHGDHDGDAGGNSPDRVQTALPNPAGPVARGREVEHGVHSPEAQDEGRRPARMARVPIPISKKASPAPAEMSRAKPGLVGSYDTGTWSPLVISLLDSGPTNVKVRRFAALNLIAGTQWVEHPWRPQLWVVLTATTVPVVVRPAAIGCAAS